MKKLVQKCIALLALGVTLSVSSYAGSILIVNGSSGTSEPSTTAQITTNLQTLMQAVGNTVTVSSNIPANLSPYSQVWDIRFSNVFALTAADQAQYLAFLAGGGGMFLMGENSSFMSRNDSVLAFIAAAGGGTLSFVVPSDTQVVVAPFNNPNGPVSQVTYAAPGGVNGKGTGQWITQVAGTPQGTGVAFGVGTLANAPAGALTTIFDVNFMQNAYDIPNSQNLTKNLIGFVAQQVEPPVNGVPDTGSTLALFALALAGVVGVRRFTRSAS